MFPFASSAFTAVPAATGLPCLSRRTAELSLIGTSTSPAVNVGIPFCVSPWIPVEVASLAVGVTPVTVGVYFPFDVTGT